MTEPIMAVSTFCVIGLDLLEEEALALSDEDFAWLKRPDYDAPSVLSPDNVVLVIKIVDCEDDNVLYSLLIERKDLKELDNDDDGEIILEPYSLEMRCWMQEHEAIFEYSLTSQDQYGICCCHLFFDSLLGTKHIRKTF
jgi:hypothetical protein